MNFTRKQPLRYPRPLLAAKVAASDTAELGAVVTGTIVAIAVATAIAGWAIPRIMEAYNAEPTAEGKRQAIAEMRANADAMAEEAFEQSAEQIKAQESIKAEQRMRQRIEQGYSTTEARAQYRAEMVEVDQAINDGKPEALAKIKAGILAKLTELENEALQESSGAPWWVWVAAAAVLAPAIGLAAWHGASRLRK